MSGLAMVTGAGGFLGGLLVREFSRAGRACRAIVRPGGKRESLPGVDWFEWDLLSGPLPQASMEGVTELHHFAGGYRADQDLERLNVEMTRLVLKSASEAGVRRIILLSSAAVNARTRGPVLDESASPASRYGWTKLRAEALLRDGDSTGLEWSIVRPVAVFGEHRASVVTKIANALRRHRFALGGSQNPLPLIYAEDFLAAHLAIARSPAAVGQAYLICGDGPTATELVEAIRAECGIEWRPPRVPKAVLTAAAGVCDVLGSVFGIDLPLSRERLRFLDPPRAYSDAKVRREIGVGFPVGWREGVRRALSRSTEAAGVSS